MGHYDASRQLWVDDCGRQLIAARASTRTFTEPDPSDPSEPAPRPRPPTPPRPQTVTRVVQEPADAMQLSPTPPPTTVTKVIQEPADADAYIPAANNGVLWGDTVATGVVAF